MPLNLGIGIGLNKRNVRHAGTPPVNTAIPTISGTTTVGSTLTATTGTWTGAPTPSFTYQWLRAGTPIGGATSSTYVIVVADQANTLTVRVTGTNSQGTASANSAGVAIP